MIEGQGSLITKRWVALTGPVIARELLRLALVGLAYWIAARLSLRLALIHGQVTPIWPPTGIAVVALLLIGRRVWPAITLAAFAINLPIGPSPLGAALIAAGNTLAPLASAELLKRSGFRLELDRLRDALALIGQGALLGMAISATVGSLVLLISGTIPVSGFGPTWAVWWTGDAMGVLLVAPFLFSLIPRDSIAPLSWRQALELAGLLAATGAVSYFFFHLRLGFVYPIFPLIMLTAWRFRLRGAAPAALIASGIAIWSAIQGAGPFTNDSLVEKMVSIQMFNVGVALTSFVLASFFDTWQRQEEMTRRYEAERLANEAKSSFLNMAAHELRTPISVLTGYLALLADGSLGRIPEQWNRPLEVLRTKAQELNKMVDDLLVASRIDAKALIPVHGRVDLAKVVHDAVARARPRADLLGAEIVTELAHETVPVEADPEQLGRILDNLINNGLTYTIKPPRVAIKLRTDDHQAVVRVSDNGIGVPLEERERVFDRFHRSNNPAFQRVPGTGLGLYISRQLAEQHGGSLVIEGNGPEGGAQFVLALPLAPGPVKA